nr:retrotransposon protein, putative, Ty3-gypsy subclass [Tanacetum cinerariifolium]
MPFGIKNDGATYQRLVNTIFEGQIGRNLEAYVDDMVIKSKIEPEMIKDVEETLLTLKKVNMKLNLKKCSFRMEEGKFLGYVVTSEGIRENPEKANAVVNMLSPSNLKQMQRLSGKLAALNRFLSKAAKRALPCLDTLKKKQREDIMVEDNSTQVKTKELNNTLAKGESMQEQEAMEIKAPKNLRTKTCIWKLYTDGASNEHRSKACLILIDPEGAEYSYALRLNFAKSNNDAEYEALLAGLRIETKIKVKKMHAFVDSKLVASQAEGSYEAKEANTIIEEAIRTWMTPIKEYIKKKILPEDSTEAQKIQEKACNYTIEEGVLYRKSYLGTLLRCIGVRNCTKAADVLSCRFTLLITKF